MNTKGIIVNLSKHKDFVEATVGQITGDSRDWSFMDFSGSKLDFKNVKCFSARLLDPNNQIEKSSIREYVNAVGDLSLGNDNFRQFQVNKFPVYWLTNFAEKHPFKQWLFAFFFFESFIRTKSDFFNEYEEVIIISPVSENDLRGYLEKHWPSFKQKLKVISSSRSIRLPILRTYYRAVRFYLKYIKSYFLKSISHKKYTRTGLPDIMLVNAGGYNPDFILKKHVNQFLADKGVFSTFYLQNILFNPSGADADFLTKAYPPPFKVFSMLYQILKNSKKVARLQKEASVKNDFWGVIITAELYDALQLIPLLFIHLWLTRIFLSAKKTLKAFYDDEMYKTGRIISSAAMLSNNPFIKTIAYQHGNITENHAVYRFCDAEIKESLPGRKDAVPLPGTFLVWGEYFKRQFLEWFSPNPDKVVVAGNLLYLELQKKYPQDTAKGSTTIKRILWCTTSFEFAKSEYEIVRREFDRNNFTISVRMHPQYQIKNQLRQIIPDSLYSAILWDDQPEIYDAINNSDLVLCSGHSTVFIDCLILKKPVIRLFNLSVMNDYLAGANVFVRNALTPEAFSDALSYFSSGNNPIDISEYLFLESSETWQKIART